jgi:hypothetical protein
VPDTLSKRAGHNEAQRTRVESIGILIASGLIAGEALTGLLMATLRYYDIEVPGIFADPSYLFGFAVMLALGAMMIRLPLRGADVPKIPRRRPP